MYIYTYLAECRFFFDGTDEGSESHGNGTHTLTHTHIHTHTHTYTHTRTVLSMRYGYDLSQSGLLSVRLEQLL